MKGCVCRRNAAINGAMHEHFANILSSHPIIGRGAQVHPQLVAAIQSHHQPNREQASRMPRQAGASPYLSPRIARDQVLEVRIEIVFCRLGAITCASPSTLRRTSIPAAWRSFSSIAALLCSEKCENRCGKFSRSLPRGQVRRIELDQAGVWHAECSARPS